MTKFFLMTLIVSILICPEKGYANASSPLLKGELDKTLEKYIQKFNFKSPVRDNSKTLPLYELGRELFFSTKLSLAGDISCAHCHHPTRGTGDNLPLALGTGADGDISFRTQGSAGVTKRNSPALWNRSLKSVKFLFWDGRVKFNKRENYVNTPSDLLTGKDPILADVAKEMINAAAAQALFPPTSSLEMKGPTLDGATTDVVWEAILANILKEENLRIFFQLAYPGIEEYNIGHVGKAISHFEEIEFFVNDTPWDDYLAGNVKALSIEEKKGAITFMDKAKCAQCHSGERFSDNSFENIMIADVGMKETQNDMGRYEVTGDEEDKYRFLTPGLRNISKTAPYMHNGILTTLEEVVNHYDHPMRTLMHFDPEVLNKKYGKFYNDKFVRDWDREKVKAQYENRSERLSMNLRLTPEEKKNLILFMEKSLTSKK